jgi:hypothetical protein
VRWRKNSSYVLTVAIVVGRNANEVAAMVGLEEPVLGRSLESGIRRSVFFSAFDSRSEYVYTFNAIYKDII